MKTKETTFGNVVLGASISLNGYAGQKIDEPIGNGKNKYGQDRNVAWDPKAKNPVNLSESDVVETTYFSLKDEPENRHK